MATEPPDAQAYPHSLALCRAMRSLKIFPLLPLLVCALPSCTAGLRMRAQQAERSGAYYEAERLYKELYKRTPPKNKGLRAHYSRHAAQAAYRGRRYTLAHSLWERARHLQPTDSLPTESERHTTLSTAPRSPSDSLSAGYYEVHPFEPLRSTRSDYGVTFAPDGRSILFGSHRRSSRSKVTSVVTGEPFGRIYQLTQQADGKWLTAPDSLRGLADPTTEIGTPSLSPDGRKLYYTYISQRAGEDNTPQIWVATPDEHGGWQPQAPLRLFSDSTRLVAHPSLSPSGRRLFFVSTSPDTLRHDKELYYVDLYGETLGTPTLLPAEINSQADELFPHATSDSTLYFASDRPGGFGGLDIHRAVLLSDGQATTTHLPSPINSPADELSYAPSPSPEGWPNSEPLAEVGLLASSRDDARSLPHLYTVLRRPMTTTIRGYVLDREGEPLSGATVRIVGHKPDETERLVTTDQEGAFSLAVAPETEYILLAGKQDYLNQFVRLSTDPQKRQSEVYTVEFFLASRVRPEALREVYYAFDRADLLTESTPALETLYKLLTDNPEVKIRLTAHTDRHGSARYNQRLAQRRAESVVRYLIGRGIASERLEAVGRGSAEPYRISKRIAQAHPFLSEGTLLTPSFIAGLQDPKEQELCDQLNRRTAFEVLPTR